MNPEANTEKSTALGGRRTFLYLAIVAAFALVAFWTCTSREPMYHGRTVTQWLRYYPEYKQKDRREAEAAVRSFGTNGIPYVMRELCRRDQLITDLLISIWDYGPRWVKDLVGVPGYQRLHLGYAAEIFGAIGPSSIPILMDSLDSRNPTVQCAAAEGLRCFGSTAGVALPILRQHLKQVGSDLRLTVVLSISIAEIEGSTNRNAVGH